MVSFLKKQGFLLILPLIFFGFFNSSKEVTKKIIEDVLVVDSIKSCREIRLPIEWYCDSIYPFSFDSIEFDNKFDINGMKVALNEKQYFAGRLLFSYNDHIDEEKYYLFFEASDILVPIVRKIKNGQVIKEIRLTSNIYCGSDEFFIGREKIIINQSGEVTIFSEGRDFKRDSVTEKIIISTINIERDTLRFYFD